MGGVLGNVVRWATGQSDDDDSGDSGLMGIGLSMIPGVGGYMGQKEANKANAAQSAAQMQFQERMSSTAHQREVEDLKKAGLNPLLSANAGASSPPGAMAEMKNSLESLGQTGKGIADLFLAKEQIAKTNADRQLVESQKKNVDMDTTVKAKDVPKSDVMNSVYNWAKKTFDNATRTNTSPREKALDEYMKKFDREMKSKQKPIQLRSR